MDYVELGFFQGVLEAEGIHCIVKNEFLSSASGELPVNETWPEIWVADADWLRSKVVLQDMQPDANAKSWRCDLCGELIEPQFAVCWHCVQGAVLDR